MRVVYIDNCSAQDVHLDLRISKKSQKNMNKHAITYAVPLCIVRFSIMTHTSFPLQRVLLRLQKEKDSS